MQANVKHRISELLSSMDHVSVTTDIWSSSHSHLFMSLTAHFIVISMEKKHVMLSAWKFDQSHNADNISAAILSHNQSWEIEEKLVCVLRDNAGNMIAGMRVASIPSLPCLAHSLQLVIKDGVLLQPVVPQLLSCAWSIVGHYHRSNVAFQTFQQIQQQLGLPQHCLVQDVATCWNSSYYMLERLVEQKKAITAANIKCHPPTELRAPQWVLAEKVVKLLEMFEEVTHEASGDYASAYVIIPIINTLKRALVLEEDDHGIKGMKREMLTSIEDRYGTVEQNSLCALATILDPRFKLRAFSTAGNAAHARMLLTTECEEYLSKSTPTRVSSQEDQPQVKCQKVDSECSSSTPWNLFNEMLADTEEANSEGLNSGHTPEMMVEMYLKEHVQSRHTDSLEYWKQKKPVWLPLAHLACKYLSIPSSSAALERLFSSAADIISQERNQLLPEKAER